MYNVLFFTSKLDFYNYYSYLYNIIKKERKMKKTTENDNVRIVLPFEYSIGDDSKYFERTLETPDDCIDEALNELADGIIEPQVELDTRYDLSNINWELLKKQKVDLLYAIDATPDSIIADSLEGILNLIDSIQDHAVDVMGLPEKTVFNITED